MCFLIREVYRAFQSKWPKRFRTKDLDLDRGVKADIPEEVRPY